MNMAVDYNKLSAEELRSPLSEHDRIIEQKDKMLENKDRIIKAVKEAIRLHKLRRFDASSEKSVDQHELFNEADWPWWPKNARPCWTPTRLPLQNPAKPKAANRCRRTCPANGGTISAIAQGASNNLIERAADVAIKEKRQLIVVPRETPVSMIHLENQLRLVKLGVTVLPASPGFYQNPETVADLVDFVVARILDQLGIQQGLMPRWGE